MKQGFQDMFNKKSGIKGFRSLLFKRFNLIYTLETNDITKNYVFALINPGEGRKNG